MSEAALLLVHHVCIICYGSADESRDAQLPRAQGAMRRGRGRAVWKLSLGQCRVHRAGEPTTKVSRLALVSLDHCAARCASVCIFFKALALLPLSDAPDAPDMVTRSEGRFFSVSVSALHLVVRSCRHVQYRPTTEAEQGKGASAELSAHFARSSPLSGRGVRVVWSRVRLAIWGKTREATQLSCSLPVTPRASQPARTSHIRKISFLGHNLAKNQDARRSLQKSLACLLGKFTSN